MSIFKWVMVGIKLPFYLHDTRNTDKRLMKVQMKRKGVGLGV